MTNLMTFRDYLFQLFYENKDMQKEFHDDIRGAYLSAEEYEDALDEYISIWEEDAQFDNEIVREYIDYVGNVAHAMKMAA